MRRPITTIDLFAGAGGLTAGLHEASQRFRPVVAVEMDPAAAATYRQNHARTAVVDRKIEDWLADDVVPEVDVVVGGPPCQGFSQLGKQDVADERNSLWRQYAHVLELAKPKYFIVENVAQFLISPQFSAFRRQMEPGQPLGDYVLDLAEVANAAEFGAAQTRRRAVMIGRRRDVSQVPVLMPTHPGPATWRTVRDAIGDLEGGVTRTDLPYTDVDDSGMPGPFKTSDLHITRNYTPLSRARIQFIPEGGNRHDIPFTLQPTCWRNHKTGSWDVMGRLWWDRPSVTIRTEFVKPEKGRYLHPVEHRALTLQEGARLQGFDDDYKWCGSKTAIAKQIGNAVPIPLGAAIGRALLAVL